MQDRNAMDVLQFLRIVEELGLTSEIAEQLDRRLLESGPEGLARYLDGKLSGELREIGERLASLDERQQEIVAGLAAGHQDMPLMIRNILQKHLCITYASLAVNLVAVMALVVLVWWSPA